MQRIISVEASRSSNLASEFVTKRLCCSLILSIAFFAIIGGFLLGRYTTDRYVHKMRVDLLEMTRRLNETIAEFDEKIDFAILAGNCTISGMFEGDFGQVFGQIQQIRVRLDGRLKNE